MPAAPLGKEVLKRAKCCTSAKTVVRKVQKGAPEGGVLQALGQALPGSP